jgi:hypothetical protein
MGIATGWKDERVHGVLCPLPYPIFKSGDVDDQYRQPEVMKIPINDGIPRGMIRHDERQGLHIDLLFSAE